MILALLTLFTALAISAVAAYYSIIGLIAIFSAAVVPIAVMGVVLELGKLVTLIFYSPLFFPFSLLMQSTVQATSHDYQW